MPDRNIVIRACAEALALLPATDDFARDHARFIAAGVTWVRRPAGQPYGRVAVFADLYGNLWDLIEFAGTQPDRRPDASA